MFRTSRFNALGLGLICGTVFLSGLLFYHGRPMGEDAQPKALHPTLVGAPARLLEAGPYGTNIRATFASDKLSVKLKASRLYLKKAKTLGFSNALLKKMVARDLTLVVKQEGAVILSLTKAYQELPTDMDAFTIDHPHILHPSEMVPPDRVLIDKLHCRIILWHGGEQTIWDLSEK
jgi:hypothetical protein